MLRLHLRSRIHVLKWIEYLDARPERSAKRIAEASDECATSRDVDIAHRVIAVLAVDRRPDVEHEVLDPLIEQVAVKSRQFLGTQNLLCFVLVESTHALDLLEHVLGARRRRLTRREHRTALDQYNDCSFVA